MKGSLQMLFMIQHKLFMIPHKLFMIQHKPIMIHQKVFDSPPKTVYDST